MGNQEAVYGVIRAVIFTTSTCKLNLARGEGPVFVLFGCSQHQYHNNTNTHQNPCDSWLDQVFLCAYDGSLDCSYPY